MNSIIRISVLTSLAAALAACGGSQKAVTPAYVDQANDASLNAALANPVPQGIASPDAAVEAKFASAGELPETPDTDVAATHQGCAGLLQQQDAFTRTNGGLIVAWRDGRPVCVDTRRHIKTALGVARADADEPSPQPNRAPSKQGVAKGSEDPSPQPNEPKPAIAAEDGDDDPSPQPNEPKPGKHDPSPQPNHPNKLPR